MAMATKPCNSNISSIFEYKGQSVANVPKNVTHVKIDSCMKRIEREAFLRRTKLVFVEFDHGVQTIGYDAFAHCRLLKHILFSSTILDIRDDAMAHCKNLTFVSLPKGLKWIGERTFADCTALKSIQIPSSVTEIRLGTFYNCRRLTSIELQYGLKCIGSRAFFGCTTLKNLMIPATVDIVEPDAFCDCIKLQHRFPYTEELNDALRQRFRGLPIHQLCYTNAFQDDDYSTSSTSSVEVLNNLLIEEAVKTPSNRINNELKQEQVDCFGMTPFHILALSTKPNADLLRRLLQVKGNFGSYLDGFVQKKDRWGNVGMYYLCMNKDSVGGSKEMISCVIEMAILKRSRWLGLDRWKDDITSKVESFLIMDEEMTKNRRTKWTGIEQFDKIFAALKKYELLETLSLLECILWKQKIDDVREESMKIEHKNGDGARHREYCRINCGSDIVISHVLPFFGRPRFLRSTSFH